MNHTIMIRGIRDLTDARYYAAMGVDWISLEVNSDPKSFATWHAIREWVEGPRFAVEFDRYDEAVFAKAIIDLQPAGIIVSADQSFPVYDDIQLFTCIREPEASQLASIAVPIWQLEEHEVMLHAVSNANVLIETTWHTALIQQLLHAGYQGGFCFNATGTTQVGVMDYSDIDEMLAAIQGG